VGFNVFKNALTSVILLVYKIKKVEMSGTHITHDRGGGGHQHKYFDPTLIEKTFSETEIQTEDNVNMDLQDDVFDCFRTGLMTGFYEHDEESTGFSKPGYSWPAE
jgi:hypothetical protein